MSRSKKKTPIFGNCGAGSQKDDKRKANQKHRSHERDTLKRIEKNPDIIDEVSFDKMNEVSDVWDMAMDGKGYWSEKDARRSDANWSNWCEQRGFSVEDSDPSFHESWKKSIRK